MIIKSFEADKINFEKNNFFLLYGENQGSKNIFIKKNFYNKFSKNTFRYEEREILVNKEHFFATVFSRSFFEKEKLIIISRVTEKIIEIIEEINEKKIIDINLILVADILDKKSKLRSLFEKGKNLLIIAFYADNAQTLSNVVNLFFKQKKISISQETINILVDRSRGDKENLQNELDKIENFVKNKKKIDLNDVLKLTNLAENYNVSELTDSCLAKNIRKTINILNENNYSTEDCMLITRTLLIKSKRLFKIINEAKNTKNINQVISSFKPPIFWKDKEVVKNQIKSWNSETVERLIYKTNEIELLIKKNSNNSINILSDFIIEQATVSNN
ncbi:MAG: DNA polymerase-3 subunit delta [Pelagibacterales bacterium]|nr:DNA polymerase-3 subunit delta [Pelagibacterales bacterium]